MDTKLFEEKHKELLPIINTAWNMIDSADDVTLQSWYEAIDYIITNNSNRLDGIVSFAEPNQQLFTVAEVMSFLESQRKDCVEAYRENTEDYQIYDDTVCAIENAPLPPEFVKRIIVKS